jgi:transcriptional regulator with PAS, ATPase and Fis domain
LARTEERKVEKPEIPWAKEFPGAVTVCDAEGVILWMNDRSAEAYAELGGRDLIGVNMLDCHPEPSRSRVCDMLATRCTNVYTTEKAGVRKLIYQTPWFEDGQHRGLVEIALVLPETMPHFVRDAPPSA